MSENDLPEIIGEIEFNYNTDKKELLCQNMEKKLASMLLKR